MSVPHLHLLVGEFGTGKSFRLLEYGAELAERYQKSIVANFPIDLSRFEQYCKAKGYKWLLSMISFRRIFYLPSVDPKEIDRLLERQNSVVLLDEAGIFLNARSWAQTPKGFLASLVQVRKDGIHFVIACHFLEQIDKQLRDNAQAIVECRALSVMDRRLKRPRMLFRWWHCFKPRKYSYWLSNPQFQQNWLRTWMLADATFFKFVIPWRIQVVKRRDRVPGVADRLQFLFQWEISIQPSADALLFTCFDSFHRLDKVKSSKPRFLMSVRSH